MSLDLRISLNKLELFCLAAELKSFGRAAEQAYITQPVMTAHMRSLADRLGAELFVRQGNRMVLTPEGEVAYEWARDSLARARTMSHRLEQLGDGLRGSVTISASNTVGSYILPDILADFRRSNPEVRVTLVVDVLETTVRGVEIGEHDFGVVMARQDLSHVPALTLEQIGSEEMILVDRNDGVDKTRLIDAREVGQLELLAFPKSLSRQRLAEQILSDSGIPDFTPVMELGSAEAMKRAVYHGLGAAFLFRSSVADELARGELREVQIAGTYNATPIQLIRRAEHELTPLQQRIVEAIREGLARRPADQSSPRLARVSD